MFNYEEFIWNLSSTFEITKNDQCKCKKLLLKTSRNISVTNLVKTYTNKRNGNITLKHRIWSTKKKNLSLCDSSIYSKTLFYSKKNIVRVAQGQSVVIQVKTWYLSLVLGSNPSTDLLFIFLRSNLTIILIHRYIICKSGICVFTPYCKI